MDNLGSHKGKIVRRLIRSAGAKLFFLSKYSPDLNPHRTGLRQAQTSAPKARCANRRCSLRRNPLSSDRIHFRRMRQLPQKCRLPSRFFRASDLIKSEPQLAKAIASDFRQHDEEATPLALVDHATAVHAATVEQHAVAVV
jgi:DDE superfamily endonuclease